MIQRDDRGDIAVLRLDHGKANAIDRELFADLEAHLAELEGSQVRAAVVTGTGHIFSAGVDLFRILDEDVDYLESFLPTIDGVLLRIARLSLPVVAAVNGHAIAGGCLLAAICDRRIMSDNERGRIGVSELLVGVPFPVAALETLRGLLPYHAVQDLVLTGRTVGPQEALALGLVDELVDAENVLETALHTARRLAEVPPDTFAVTKRQLRAPMLREIDRQSALETEIAAVWKTPEARERIRTFLEKTVGKSR